MKTKLLSTIIMMAIGGFIGLQSTVSSTAKAETIIVHKTDTVVNTIIDKRIVVATDTVVRDRPVTKLVRDDIWAAKAMRLVPLPMQGLQSAVEEDLSLSVSID
jgi:hypothetical protein